MTSKEALKELKENAQEICKWELDRLEIIGKDLEILEIIKKNPELVWWCCCYENATQMLIDRRAFRLNDNVDEIIEDFNKVKEWMKNDK